MLAVFSMLNALGCESSRVVYETGPTLAPADLGLPETGCASTGFLILEPGSSIGRFPTALAVAGLEGRDENGALAVVSLDSQEALRWNSVFDAAPAIREVIVLNEKTPGPPLKGPPAVTATAKRLNAGLCLIYGRTAWGPDETALVGALVDTGDGHVVAQVQARATAADHEPLRPDRPKGDLRHLDLQYLVAGKFRRVVRECVVELIKRDKQPPEQRPSPWRSAIQPAEDE